jgi:glutaredoxin
MQTQTRAYNVRADSDKPLIVEGLPVIFDSPANVGGVTEIISPRQQHLLSRQNLVK